MRIQSIISLLALAAAPVLSVVLPESTESRPLVAVGVTLLKERDIFPRADDNSPDLCNTIADCPVWMNVTTLACVKQGKDEKKPVNLNGDDAKKGDKKDGHKKAGKKNGKEEGGSDMDGECQVRCKKDKDCKDYGQNISLKVCPKEYPASPEVRKKIGPQCIACGTEGAFNGLCGMGPT